jgi:beta-galactosidase
LLVANDVRLGGKDLTDLPRIGVCLHLAPGFERLRYFGRGPRENYSDRRSAEMLGVYESTVTDEYVPYLMPQEHGHHVEVRWLELQAQGRRAVRISGVPLVEFNASHFTAEDLFAAHHTIDLVPRPETILYLDLAQRGLGTASCGPDALEAYRLQARRYRWSYELALI